MLSIIKYKTNKYIENARAVFAIGSAILGLLSALVTFVCLIWMLAECGGVSERDKYISYDYQEYLINNPSYTLKVNDQELTKYKRPELRMPLVVSIDMGNGDKYEVFIKKKNDWVSIKPKELYIYAKGG